MAGNDGKVALIELLLMWIRLKFELNGVFQSACDYASQILAIIRGRRLYVIFKL